MSTSTFYYPNETGWAYYRGSTLQGYARFLITQETNDDAMTSTVTCVLQVLRSNVNYSHRFDGILKINDDASYTMNGNSSTASASTSSNTTKNIWSSITTTLLTTTVNHASDGTASLHFTLTKTGRGFGSFGVRIFYSSSGYTDYKILSNDEAVDTYITLTPISAGGKVKVFNGSEWVSATPYVYKGSGWAEAKAYVYDGSWKMTTS